MSDEQWRAVVGYEGLYEVSNHGRVRSIDRIVTNSLGRTYRLRGKTLRLSSTYDGRPTAVLSKDGVEKPHRVLRLVAASFIGPCPEGMEVCHNNGDRSDNRASNLRYDTRSANILDNVKHGVHFNARKTHCALGHLYDMERRDQNGRRCSICMEIWYQNTLAKRKARRAAMKVSA